MHYILCIFVCKVLFLFYLIQLLTQYPRRGKTPRFRQLLQFFDFIGFSGFTSGRSKPPGAIDFLTDP
jgi:hypothetical protein